MEISKQVEALESLKNELYLELRLYAQKQQRDDCGPEEKEKLGHYIEALQHLARVYEHLASN